MARTVAFIINDTGHVNSWADQEAFVAEVKKSLEAQPYRDKRVTAQIAPSYGSIRPKLSRRESDAVVVLVTDIMVDLAAQVAKYHPTSRVVVVSEDPSQVNEVERVTILNRADLATPSATQRLILED